MKPKDCTVRYQGVPILRSSNVTSTSTEGENTWDPDPVSKRLLNQCVGFGIEMCVNRIEMGTWCNLLPVEWLHSSFQQLRTSATTPSVPGSLNHGPYCRSINWQSTVLHSLISHIWTVTWLDFYCVVSFYTIQTSEWSAWHHCRNRVTWLPRYERLHCKTHLHTPRIKTKSATDWCYAHLV